MDAKSSSKAFGGRIMLGIAAGFPLSGHPEDSGAGGHMKFQLSRFLQHGVGYGVLHGGGLDGLLSSSTRPMLDSALGWGCKEVV